MPDPRIRVSFTRAEFEAIITSTSRGLEELDKDRDAFARAGVGIPTALLMHINKSHTGTDKLLRAAMKKGWHQ